jgi:hypothetical protein
MPFSLTLCSSLSGKAAAAKASVALGPAPLKAEAALRIAEPRLADEIAAKEGIEISRSQLSKVLRQKGDFASDGRGTR